VNPRVFLADIETSPITAHVWGLRDQTIGLNQIRKVPRVIGIGGKWLGQNYVGWKSEYHQSRMEMLEWSHAALDKADIVVHFNGTTFDIPWLIGEFAKEDMPPPSPFKNIDLYRVARKNFRLPSYKLQYVSQHLGIGQKLSTGGHDLWVRCLEGEGEDQRKAWALMRRYCKQDVALLEPLFHKLKPYFPGAVNMAVYGTETTACQKCGSTDLESRGTAYTAQRAYPQYRCNDCGGWTRDSKSSWSINTVGVTR
jgi:hypothetical protein